MKKIIVILFALLFSKQGFSQLTSSPNLIIDNLPKPSSSLILRGSTPVNCNQDTAEYPRYKATGFVGVGFVNNNAVGQFFDAPQNIKVSGFTFYAWMSSVARTQKSRIACFLYAAGLDSLPTGSPLARDTITIDSTFGGGVLSVIEKHAKFDTAITVNYKYVLVVKNLDTSFASIVCNSYTAGDGRRENLNSATIGSLWYRGLNLNIGGTTFDADIQIYPHVSYTIKNDFIVKDQCFKIADSVKFINLYKNSVLGSKFYNRYVYYNYDRFCFRWQYDITSFSSFNDINGATKYANSNNYEVRLISSLFHYRNNFSACIDSTEKMVYYQPIAGVPLGTSIACKNDSIGIKISQKNNEIYEWYNNLVDTIPAFKGTTYTQKPAIISDTFYIRSVNDNCKSSKSFTKVTVNEYPIVSKIKSDSICSGAIANLEVSSDIGITRWYKDSIGGAPLSSNAVFSVGPLFSDTMLYAEVSNGSCKLNNRIPVKVIVGNSFAPIAPAVSKDTVVCLKNISTLAITAFSANNDSIRWFNVASGGTPIHRGGTYNFMPSADGIFTFYADAWNGVCGSSRIPVKVTINNYATPSAIADAAVCKGEDATLSAQLPQGILSWFSDTLLTPVFSGLSRTIINAQNSDSFYLRSSYNGCTSNALWKVKLTVNEAPKITGLVQPTICAGNSTNLSFTLPYGTADWYTDSLIGSSFNSTNNFTTPLLFGTISYFVQSSFKGCKSNFVTIRANVNPKPAAGFTYTTSGLTVLFNALPGNNITTWDWDLGNSEKKSTANFSYTYPQKGIYDVRLIMINTAGCRDTAIVTINVGRVSIENINTFTANIYPNPIINNQFQFNSNFPVSEIAIISMDGKTVFQLNFKIKAKQQFVDMPSVLSKGLYIVVLKNEYNQIDVQKIVKD